MDSGADVTVKDVDLRSCVRVAVGHADTMAVLLQVTICTLGAIGFSCVISGSGARFLKVPVT